MMEQSIQEQVLVSDLLSLLQTLPQVDAHLQTCDPEVGSTRYDARIEARFGELPFELWVATKGDVFPRDAREQLDRWRRSSQMSEPPSRRHLLVAAHTISPGARELLANAGVGYFDGGGSLCLPFTGAYTLIDRPAERRKAAAFDLFTEARTPVLQAMLLKPELPYTIYDLAGDVTGSSSATISKLMAQLEREDWVTVEGSGPFKRRKLSSPDAVLDAWVAAETSRLSQRRVRRFFVRGHKAVDLPKVMTAAVAGEYPAAGRTHHFTAEAAAHHHAPFLTTWNVTTMRATQEMTQVLCKGVDAVEVEQGYNLLVIEDGLSALRFSEAAGPISIASSVQTYVDLMCASGRAPDAARHLREQALKF
jgi:hypothetical protein